MKKIIKLISIFGFIYLPISGCAIFDPCQRPNVCCYPIEKKQKTVDEVDHSQDKEDSQIKTIHKASLIKIS